MRSRIAEGDANQVPLYPVLGLAMSVCVVPIRDYRIN